MILRRIAECLKPYGHAIISVMNYDLTYYKAKHVFVFEENPNKLLDLAPADIMEKTGNIFDPDYYMVDKQTHVVYRKEQFTYRNDQLPTELIVRDRRYSKDEIVDMCELAGLRVQWSKYVGTGKWHLSLTPYDSSAKEILLFCTKR